MTRFAIFTESGYIAGIFRGWPSSGQTFSYTMSSDAALTWPSAVAAIEARADFAMTGAGIVEVAR